MIPTSDIVVEGWRFVSRRWRLPAECSLAAVKAALALAEGITVGEERDEPAAMLYAFARHPRSFPAGYRIMTTLLALNQARSLGWLLRTTSREVETIIFAALHGHASEEDVKQWVAERLEPF